MRVTIMCQHDIVSSGTEVHTIMVGHIAAVVCTDVLVTGVGAYGRGCTSTTCVLTTVVHE